MGDQNNTPAVEEQIMLLSVFILQGGGWHSNAVEGKGLRAPWQKLSDFHICLADHFQCQPK